jgi:hypothetical protein
MQNPNGYIIYEGPSAIDGAPIVVIATGFASRSANGKTGDMVQTWILPADIAPHHAVKSGADASVCGDCIHRPALRDAVIARGEVFVPCYVKTFQAPLSVFGGYQRGIYPRVTLAQLAALCTDRMVRIGSYGDPYAAPIAIWRAMTSQAKGWTGYTHQWRVAGRVWAALVMASADSIADMAAAHAAGFRTFRVTAKPFENVKGVETVCPASKEKGAVTDCATCRACMGTSGKARASVQIARH